MCAMNLEDTTLRIRNLFLPVVALSLAFTFFYSLLDWFLVARNGWIPLDEDVADIWLPGGFAWILVIFLIQPRLRMLNLRDKRKNLPPLYHFAAVAVVAVPAIIAQGYVRTATGDIAHVADISLVSSNKPSKFYVADNVCMHLNRPVSHAFITTSGKGNQTLNFDFYVLAPVCSASGTTDQRLIWLGLKFHQSMSNSASKADKNIAYDEFVRKSLQSFNAEDPRDYKFLETLGHNSDRKRFDKTLKVANNSLPFPMILIPHREPFEKRTGDRLAWLTGSIVCGLLLWLVLVFIRPIERAQGAHAQEMHKQGTIQPHGWLRTFTSFKSDYGLPFLLFANIAVFLVMAFAGLGVMSFDSDDLLAWGANYRPAIHGLGIFRLIASQFVHGGLIHLMNNLYGLLFTGLFLVPVVTKGRLIACYLFCGLGGSIASVLVHPATISIGASGAIFGLFGILLTLVLLRDPRLEQTRKLIFLNTGIFVALNLLIGAATPGIDNAAHLGGLLAGVLLATGIFLSHRLRLSRMATRPASAR
jgi:membrane associated rhomboid family serine protease